MNYSFKTMFQQLELGLPRIAPHIALLILLYGGSRSSPATGAVREFLEMPGGKWKFLCEGASLRKPLRVGQIADRMLGTESCGLAEQSVSWLSYHWLTEFRRTL